MSDYRSLKAVDPEVYQAIADERASELLADRRARGPVKKKAAAKKAPAKKTAAKKAPAKKAAKKA